MRRLAHWWAATWDRRESPSGLALLRICLGGLLCLEFLGILQLGLADVLYATVEEGGLAQPSPQRTLWWFDLVGTGPTQARVLVWILAAVSAGFMVGVATPVCAAVLLLLYAQTAQIFPYGDRAIDVVLRNALAILVFSRAGAAWSVDARLRTGRWAGSGADIPAWPRYLIVLQLIVMYCTAGLQKFADPWWPWGGFSALYLILNDWAYAKYPFDWLIHQPFYAFTQIGTAVTMFFQITYPILLWHYFPPASPPGRVRQWLERWHVHWLWIAVGAVFHVAIGFTMALGIFPWGMMVLYLAYLHPDELARLVPALELQRRPVTA